MTAAATITDRNLEINYPDDNYQKILIKNKAFGNFESLILLLSG